MRLFITTIVFLFLSSAIISQTISGYLFDEQHQPLIGGSISIQGTYIGVAANNDGFYLLKLQPGNYKIVVSYIGYQSDTVRVEAKANQNLYKDFVLKSASIVLSDVFVFSKKFNSAEEIVLNAIYRKEEYLSRIKNYEYSAYSKTVFILKPDSNKEIIGGIAEIQSKGFFQTPNYFQEIILAKRQTANFSELFNIFSSGKIISILDDILIIDELNVISPLNKNALDYYEFDMIDTTYFGLKKVFNISLKPKSTIIPLFEGRISIIDDIFCVVDVKLDGGDRVKSTMKCDILIEQTFREFENYFWFPVQSKMFSSLDMGLPNVKKLHIMQQNNFTNYIFNSPSFEHEFNRYSLANANLNEQTADSIWDANQYIELSKKEKDAYHSIDSSMAVKNFLVKFMINLPGLYLKIKQMPITELWDFYRYNRVEGNYLGFGLMFNNLFGISNVKLVAGYGFSDYMPKYDIELNQFVITEKLQLTFSFFNTIKLLNEFYNYRKSDITFQKIVFNNDYADYFYSKGWSLGLKWNISNARTSLSFSHNYDYSATVNADWSLFYKSKLQRNEVPILESTYDHIDFSFNYDDRKYLDYGWGYIQNDGENYFRFGLDYEIAPKQIFNNDNIYQQVHIYVNPFFKLKPYANLNITAEYGYLENDEVIQKNFHLPGAYGSFGSPYLFRTIKQDSYIGNTYLGIYAENNFKNILFNLIPLEFLKNLKYDLYLFGNYAWIKNKNWSNGLDPKYSSNDFSEFGFGIGNILLYLRMDFAWRITPEQDKNFYFNISSKFSY